MSEQNQRQIIINTVRMTTDQLTDLELATLNNVVQLDWSPRGRIFDYEKVKGLFDQNGKMHEETKIALVAIINERFGID